MSDPPDFRPTATLTALRHRAHLLEWLRSFFRAQGYCEVQTPVLSHETCVDVWVEPFPVAMVENDAGGQRTLYLQTSPEYAMKRLIAAGAEAIFQIGPAFRRGESGARHNPEFTIVEWYRVGDSYHQQMSFTEDLVTGFLHEASASCGANSVPSVPLDRPIPRWSYAAAFEQAGVATPHLSTTAELRAWADRQGVVAPSSLHPDDRDGWLNLLLIERVEPWLASLPAVFVYDYPETQAALARVRPGPAAVAERFELYCGGIELCNGYQELTDATELRRRIAVQSQLRSEARLPALPTDSRLLQAMDAGLPECAGVALGFDRLMMVATGARSLHDVIPFPIERA